MWKLNVDWENQLRCHVGKIQAHVPHSWRHCAVFNVTRSGMCTDRVTSIFCAFDGDKKQRSCKNWKLISNSVMTSLGVCLEANSNGTYWTLPNVLRRTEAAYAWVTPTRLRPSTSMIWSFTCILTHTYRQNWKKINACAKSHTTDTRFNGTTTPSGLTSA